MQNVGPETVELSFHGAYWPCTGIQCRTYFGCGPGKFRAYRAHRKSNKHVVQVSHDHAVYPPAMFKRMSEGDLAWMAKAWKLNGRTFFGVYLYELHVYIIRHGFLPHFLCGTILRELEIHFCDHALHDVAIQTQWQHEVHLRTFSKNTRNSMDGVTT